MIIAVQANEIQGLNPKTDTTLAICEELQANGHKLFFYTPEKLSLLNTKVLARGNYVKLDFTKKTFFIKSAEKEIDLSKVDAVLIRQDPPFDMHYIASTYILDNLPTRVKVLNSPESLRNHSEKFIITHFPKYILPTLVSQDLVALEMFFKKHKAVIIKPLFEFAGHGVELIDSPKSFKDKISKALKTNEYFIMQKYVESVVEKGDKRVLFLNGKLMCAFGKIPPKGKITANMAAGGTPVACDLTKREQEMCKELGKKLKKFDIFFAGADIIDGHLLEINVTSPTGVRAANELYGKNYGKVIADEIKKAGR